MSYFPNVRNEGPYCEKQLNGEDSAFVAGYDYAYSQIESSFEQMLDTEFDGDSAVMLLMRVNDPDGVSYMDRVKNAVIQWLESTRNKTVISIIDGGAYGVDE